MKKGIVIGIFLLLLGFLLGGIVFYGIQKTVTPQKQVFFQPKTPSELKETGRAFSEIVASVSPSVVNISTTKVVRGSRFSEEPFFDFFNEFFGPYHDFGIPKKWKQQGMGSGVTVSGDGYIITNNHVVSDAEEIRVTLFDKRTFKGKVVGSDPKTDIAIVKISAKDLPTIPLGDSDRLQVGEFVLAIGNPFGLSHTVTMGIISAVGRADVGIAEYEDFIQTDAAINPGNSGGPLVNTKGEIIGINTAIFSRSGGYQGIGFAVPANMVRSIMEQLLKEGKIVRGWIGVTIQALTAELAGKFGAKSAEGVLVGDVQRGGPAEKAGIKSGDIILQFNGKAARDPSALKNIIAQSRPGTRVSTKILRNGREMSFTIVTGEHPGERGEETRRRAPERENLRGNVFSGLEVMELTKDIIRQLGLRADEKGVVVADVEVGSPAEDAGIKRGDVIQEMDRKKISNLNDFYRLASKVGPSETALVLINRGGNKFYITLNVS